MPRCTHADGKAQVVSVIVRRTVSDVDQATDLKSRE